MNMRFLLATGLLALSACAGKPRPLGGSPDIAVVAGDAMPPPTRTDIVADNRPYLIGPFDKLTIDVFGIEEMKLLKVQTDASGRISFPLIGSIQAAGQTPAEVGTMIADRLRGRYIRNPGRVSRRRGARTRLVSSDRPNDVDARRLNRQGHGRIC
jgi:polysaccharide export outer membrane protein